MNEYITLPKHSGTCIYAGTIYSYNELGVWCITNVYTHYLP